MSRDSKSKVLSEELECSDGVSKVKKPSTVVDSTDDVVAPVRIQRRPRSTSKESILSPYEHLIPKGWQMRLVNPKRGRPQILYDRGYEFVEDEDGKRVFIEANSTGSAEFHKFVLMMISDERVEEVARERKKQRREQMDYNANAKAEELRKIGYPDIGIQHSK